MLPDRPVPGPGPRDGRVGSKARLLLDGHLLVGGWLVGVAVTALVVWSPYVGFAYRSPTVHLVLDTVDACVALLAAYLVHGRFVRRRRLQDLLLAQGLVLLAVAGFGLTYVPQPLAGEAGGAIDVWLPLAVRLMGAIMICAAALSAARRAVHPRLHVWLWITLVIVVPFIGVLVVAVGSRLPVAVEGTYFAPSVVPPILAGHPLLIGAQALAAICFLVASVAFTVQSMPGGDELLRWLGPACALAGFARVHYALFPSLYTDWLYTGDLLRTGFYLLLLVGAARELSRYWTMQTQAAVLEDRRRLARELHDGVIQELAYIRSESHRIPLGSAVREELIKASDRGLDEARAAIHALGSSADEPLGYVLHRVARELAERYGVDLEVDVDDSVDAHRDQQHALARITREAVSNAVRHGRAQKISVRLSQSGSHRRLAIVDDGVGFDVQATASVGSGYGLTSMRDRARALPGALEINAAPGTGTAVTVTW